AFVADNNNLIFYMYPFSKVRVDYSFLFVLFFLSPLPYYATLFSDVCSSDLPLAGGCCASLGPKHLETKQRAGILEVLK
ncbi:hypothetical protein P3689_23605, partial [Vibrio parahaemolyticus]|nr:hypothetical protein [Vibrio parahaemolyticus]